MSLASFTMTDRSTRQNSVSSDPGTKEKVNSSDKIFQMLRTMQATIDTNAKTSNEKFASLHSQITSINNTWKNELTGILHKHLEDVDIKLATFSGNVAKRIDLHDIKIEQLERKLRGNDILIRGIPFKDKENLVQFFDKLAKEIKYPYDNMYSLSSIFRLQNSQHQNATSNNVYPPPILATFSTPRLKSAFCRLFNSANLNQLNLGIDNTNHRIYITDNLTKTNRDILQKALQMKSSGLISKVQVRNGFVLVQRLNSNEIVKVLNISLLEQ